MNTALENLFDEIINTENIAQEKMLTLRKKKVDDDYSKYNTAVLPSSKTHLYGCTFLVSVKAEHDGLLKTTNDECAQLQLKRRQMAVKVKDLNDKLFKKKCLVTKAAVKREILKELEENGAKLDENMKHLCRTRAQSRELFCAGVTQFTRQYDLDGQGSHARDVKARDLLQIVVEEQQTLKHEIQCFEKAKADLQESRDEANAIAENKNHMLETVKKLEEDLKCNQKRTKELEQERQRVANVPNVDQEFKRLHQEFDQLKAEKSKEMCLALQQELKELRQAEWQRELTRRREMQQSQRLAYSLARKAPLTQGTKQTQLVAVGTSPKPQPENRQIALKQPINVGVVSKQDRLESKTASTEGCVIQGIHLVQSEDMDGEPLSQNSVNGSQCREDTPHLQSDGRSHNITNSQESTGAVQTNFRRFTNFTVSRTQQSSSSAGGKAANRSTSQSQ